MSPQNMSPKNPHENNIARMRADYNTWWFRVLSLEFNVEMFTIEYVGFVEGVVVIAFATDARYIADHGSQERK